MRRASEEDTGLVCRATHNDSDGLRPRSCRRSSAKLSHIVSGISRV
jgi:hypothetical protein